MNIQDILDGKSQEQINEKMNKFFYEKDWYPDEGSVTGPFVPGQAYQPINGLPAGGEAGQCLVKSSDKDYETVWKNFPDLPAYLKEITLERMEDWDNKQELLISGINIKTINNVSLLGKGNLEIIGGDSLPIGAEFEYVGDEVPDGYEQVPSLVDIVYPVGAVFISTVATSPDILFPGTVWEAFGTGRTLIGVDASQDEFASVEREGGHKSLQAHSHDFATTATSKVLTGGWYNTRSRFAGTNNFSGIVTNNRQYADGYYNETGGNDINSVGWNIDARHEHSGTTASVGEGDSGNLPPYVTVYMWKRIA
jgi:hypothetical protein